MASQDTDPVYVISIAADLVGMHPQTLRLYERVGLVKPARRGMLRLYSNQDIERVRQIQRLTSMGVNLAGVEIILRLQEQLRQVLSELEELRSQRLPVPLIEEDLPARPSPPGRGG